MNKGRCNLKKTVISNLPKIVTVVFVVFSFLTPLRFVYAGSATEQVKKRIDEIIAILEDTPYRKSHTKEEVHERLRAIVHGKFGWEEIARRSLGLYWKERSEDEKKEFTSLFTKLLEDTYISKTVNNYSGEKVLYDKELIEGERAQVGTRIINQAGNEVSVVYRLLKKGESWIAYDVVIEGVSMVKNYRVQFYSIIRQSSYGELVKKLKEKQLGELSSQETKTK